MSKVIAITLALLTLGLVCTRATPAQPPTDQPSRGIAHNDAKVSAVLYECHPAAGPRLQCRFTELNVWKPLRAVAVNDEERRTCTFAAHNYAQTFRREAGANGPSWVTTNVPYGVCGITRESRFIGSRQAGGWIAWSYVAQIKIAHKSAEDGSLRCAEIREFNENYSWQSAEQREDCATIHFSPGCSSDDFPCLGDGPIVVH
jgi:hypothetical protein